MALSDRHIPSHIDGHHALTKEEQRFRMVWESASDAMALSDPEGKVLAANGAYYQLYGFQPEEVIGNTFAIIFSKEEQELATAQYKAFFSSEKVDAPLERTIQRADGTIRIVEVSYDFLVQQGKRIAMISIIRDVTERKRAEEALRTSEERLRLALEAGNIGVWDWDVHENTLSWSTRIYELHGVSKDTFTVSFENFLELVHPEDKASVEEAIGQSLTAHVPFNINFRIVTPQGETRWIATSASVSYDPEGKPLRMLGATSDITGQKELEQRKDEFISIASHELKTPITALKGFAQLHRRKLVRLGATELVISLDKIEGQVDRLTRLVNDLLDVSKIQAGYLDYAEEPIVLDAFIQDIVETTQQITPSHTIVIHGTSNKVIIGDSDRLQQVFFNLINNAAKYSPQADTVDILITTSQERAMVSVHDYGVGIAKEHKDKIFDRFYRVHDAENKTFRGLGMGLYISYEIVKRHGGEITVESEEGKGSTFTVSLPFIN